MAGEGGNGPRDDTMDPASDRDYHEPIAASATLYLLQHLQGADAHIFVSH